MTRSRTAPVPFLALLVAACPAGRDRPADTPMIDIAGGEHELGAGAAHKMCTAGGTLFERCDNITGSPLAKLSHLPLTSVTVEDYSIDQHEVSNLQYLTCVDDGVCSEPALDTLDGEPYHGEEAYDDYPVVWVTRAQAAAYCAYVGKRLPTEAEWEIAGRGAQRKVFPWGDQPIGCGRAPYADPSSTECKTAGTPRALDEWGGSGGDTTGSNSDRILHMASNVAEWVSTGFDELAYCDRDHDCSADPTGCVETCEERKYVCKPAASYQPQPGAAAAGMVRGGSYARPVCAQRLFMRQAQAQAARDVGFRCAR